MKPYDEDWKAAGETAIVLDTREGLILLDTRDGKLIEITEEHSFGCIADGPTFEHHRSSRPDLPMTTDTQNYVSVACTLNGQQANEDSFSKGMVAANSRRPFAAADDWDVFDEQIRVLATADGIRAYEF